MGGVLRYKLDVYFGVSLSSRLRSQRGTALQMGGVLRYKLEVYRQYFSDKLYGLVPERCPSLAPENTKKNPKNDENGIFWGHFRIFWVFFFRIFRGHPGVGVFPGFKRFWALCQPRRIAMLGP